MSLKRIAEEAEETTTTTDNVNNVQPATDVGDVGVNVVRPDDDDHASLDSDVERLHQQQTSSQKSLQQQHNDYSSVDSPSFQEEDILHHRQQLASLPKLGPGPARFEPPQARRSTEEQLADLSDHDQNVVMSLKARWEQLYPEVPFTDEMYLQFARFSTGGSGRRVVSHHSSDSSCSSTLKKTKKVAAAASSTSNSTSPATGSASSSKRRWGFGVLMKRRGKGKGKNTNKQDVTFTEVVEVEDNVSTPFVDSSCVDSTLLSSSNKTSQVKTKVKKKKPNLFHEKKAWEAMNNFDHHYLSLTVETLDLQLRSKTLFPVPGLKGLRSCPYNHHHHHSKQCHHSHQELPMFYMRPSRYFPNSTPIEDVIDNLAYVMQSMTCGDEDAQSEGIGFIANMNGWTFQNFSVEYCAAFMSMLQGRAIPVHVELFLIVDPPTWFPAIWKIMKPMLSTQFRRKVKMVSSSELNKHLCEGFKEFLPDEMQQHQEQQRGRAKTTDIVRDFITYRQHVEELDAILVSSNEVVKSPTSKSAGSGGHHSSLESLSLSKEPLPNIILTKRSVH
mmetsp:Transcript_4330/g.10821  ORF Transcript_4330/g.10821 Transcript_4330/m.10821 type:complete len:557 (-) Transcript_4330:86-1756(-)|eukprot:CAMPEP_0113470794 /NCGR_PEP_ID=MMETSP0014_2-20120614/16637_1 /TAXON_ID=2857 /ORGANISM="Nitzschia sp." /LENGTH=556 /DNA_ID=CAMNT_0000363391 /DNA_START=476 /DNA_END=2146 /DNA_ORIENTATION=- /assembly_acc=CAM_ASM_000159